MTAHSTLEERITRVEDRLGAMNATGPQAIVDQFKSRFSVLGEQS